MKKIFLVTLLASIILQGCNTVTNMDSLLEEDVKSISIQDGETGEIVDLKNKDDVTELKAFLQNIELEKVKDMDIKGFQYQISLKSKDDEIGIVFTDEYIIVNEEYYKAVEKVEMNTLHKYFE
ncbi:hypothetical protein CD798_00470 [Bacillaceae bacterium SAOS 7]|nr:hypothetical protein CD798_00470 [Bacillaceae bacterium SAOS 7]